jgi:hypothetical protein
MTQRTRRPDFEPQARVTPTGRALGQLGHLLVKLQDERASLRLARGSSLRFLGRLSVLICGDEQMRRDATTRPMRVCRREPLGLAALLALGSSITGQRLAGAAAAGGRSID